MGRRPHALIQEFFDRGPKLDDNSNRYQHTCKRCGEFFPKGRIDSLSTHLLRRCSNLTESDRLWVCQQLQSEAERAPKTARRSHADDFAGLAAPLGRNHQSDLPHPFAHQQQTALETLAEVSGQHSSRADGGRADADGQPHGTSHTVAEAIAEQALIAQLQRHVGGRSELPTAPDAASNVGQYTTTPVATHQVSTSAPATEPAPVPMSTAPLVAAATAANRHMEQTDDLFTDTTPVGSMTGHAYPSFNLPLDMGFRLGDASNGPAPASPWPQPAVTHAMPSFGNLTMPHTDQMAGYAILSTNPRQRPRGRFEDGRRKEVSDMRKQGACIRCRMLKKPCSGETPCKPCANVMSGRIWKFKCLRTKLSEAMTLWSKGVFQTRARTTSITTSSDVGPQDDACHVSVQVLGSEARVRLPLRAVPTADRQDGGTLMGVQSMPPWNLSREDAVGETLGSLARQHIAELSSEQPVLIAEVLKTAGRFAIAQCTDDTDGAQNDKQPEDLKRATSRQQDDLLQNVMELWALSRVMIARDCLDISLSTGEDPGSSEDTSIGVTQMDDENGRIYDQLLAAIELRCSKLSKIVLNEIERRLLQRQQTSRFTTLLAALILLSCVELMTGYYRVLAATSTLSTQQDGDSTTQDVTNRSDEALAAAANEAADGNLNDVPMMTSTVTAAGLLWLQGEQFSDLLISLLRMRALPPNTKITLDGNLEAVRDFDTPATTKPHGNESLHTKKAEEDAVADWLDAMKLQGQPLKAKRDAEVPSAEDGLDAWRLRYVARVLLP